MKHDIPDLAGIYITDDYIDVVLGRDTQPKSRKLTVVELSLHINIENHVRRFAFTSYESLEETFSVTAKWIADCTPRLRSLGVGCYGPFESIDPDDRGKPEYGQLQTTFHGDLSKRNLVTLLEDAFAPYYSDAPLITIQTDVAAAAIGIAYNRSRGPHRDTLKDQVVVFVKASLGIGGAFMRATTPWRGRLHPEMGLCHVPRWYSPALDPQNIERTWRYDRAVNPDSIEGLASVRAIEARYAPLSFEDLKRAPDHPAWERQAWYLAQMCWAINCIVSPHRIVLGGRIMTVPGLLDRVNQAYRDEIAGWPMSDSHAKLVASGDGFLDAQLGRNKEGALYAQKLGIVGSLCIAAMEDQPSALTAVPSR